jgi:hypothetical protein
MWLSLQMYISQLCMIFPIFVTVAQLLKNFHLAWNSTVSSYGHKRPPLIANLSNMTSLCNLPFHILNTHFKFSSSSIHRSSKWYLHIRSVLQNLFLFLIALLYVIFSGHFILLGLIIISLFCMLYFPVVSSSLVWLSYRSSVCYIFRPFHLPWFDYHIALLYVIFSGHFIFFGLCHIFRPFNLPWFMLYFPVISSFFVWLSYRSSVCYIFRPFHPPWFDDYNDTQWSIYGWNWFHAGFSIAHSRIPNTEAICTS